MRFPNRVMVKKVKVAVLFEMPHIKQAYIARTLIQYKMPSYQYAKSHFVNILPEDHMLSSAIDEGFAALNTLGPRQNGYHFVDDIIDFIFFKENCWKICNLIELKFDIFVL